jgi:hypothetical protein
MRHINMSVLSLLVLAFADAGAAAPSAISEARARQIAANFAGCKEPKDCTTRAIFQKDGTWAVIISRIVSHDSEEKPPDTSYVVHDVYISNTGEVLGAD